MPVLRASIKRHRKPSAMTFSGEIRVKVRIRKRMQAAIFSDHSDSVLREIGYTCSNLHSTTKGSIYLDSRLSRSFIAFIQGVQI